MAHVSLNNNKNTKKYTSPDIETRLLKEAYQIEDFNRRVKSGEVLRYANGMYYVPGEGIPESSEAIALRYISNDREVYGFYTGDCFLKSVNGVNISVNDKIEIMTNKATSGKKKLYMFGKRFILRKPYYPIDKNNVSLNAFLTYITMTPLFKIKQNYSILADYVKKAHLAANDVIEMAPHFPAKTASKLLASDLYRSLWKH